jgi:hypothetical protein
MSALRATLLTEAAGILIHLIQNVPEWQGPSKTQFDRELNALIVRLEDTEVRIAGVLAAETIAQMAAEAAVVL